MGTICHGRTYEDRIRTFICWALLSSLKLCFVLSWGALRHNTGGMQEANSPGSEPRWWLGPWSLDSSASPAAWLLDASALTVVSGFQAEGRGTCPDFRAESEKTAQLGNLKWPGRCLVRRAPPASMAAQCAQTQRPCSWGLHRAVLRPLPCSWGEVVYPPQGRKRSPLFLIDTHLTFTSLGQELRH